MNVEQVFTCDEVGVVAAELVLFLEVDLAEGDEGEDGDVVGHADEADEPKACREHEDIAEVNLRFVTLDVTYNLFYSYLTTLCSQSRIINKIVWES